MKHVIITGLIATTCAVATMQWTRTSSIFEVYRPGRAERTEINKNEAEANRPVTDPWRRDDRQDMIWPGMDLARAEAGVIDLKIKERLATRKEPIGGGRIDNSAFEIERVGSGFLPRAPTGSTDLNEWKLEPPAGWEQARLRISGKAMTYFLGKRVDLDRGPDSFGRMAKDLRQRFGLPRSGYSQNVVTHNKVSNTEVVSIEFQSREHGCKSNSSYPVSSRLESINMFGMPSRNGRYFITLFVNVHGPLAFLKPKPSDTRSAVELLGGDQPI